MAEQYPLGRLMFRVEGENWNVYFGVGPQDAICLGSIRMSLVVDQPDAKNAFMQIFTDAVARNIQDITGMTAEMTTEPAPEDELSGSA